MILHMTKNEQHSLFDFQDLKKNLCILIQFRWERCIFPSNYRIRFICVIISVHAAEVVSDINATFGKDIGNYGTVRFWIIHFCNGTFDLRNGPVIH